MKLIIDTCNIEYQRDMFEPWEAGYAEPIEVRKIARITGSIIDFKNNDDIKRFSGFDTRDTINKLKEVIEGGREKLIFNLSSSDEETKEIASLLAQFIAKENKDGEVHKD